MTDTTPTPNPSPKAQFTALKANVESHRKLLDQPQFDMSIHYALLEYMRVLCEQRTDMSGAAANQFKLIGAQEFVHVLRNLSETVRMPASRPTDNLPFNQ